MVEIKQENKETKERKARVSKNYPIIKLDEAINVAKVVKECGGHATKENLEAGLNKKGGRLGNLVAGTRRYGLIEGHGEITLTNIAERIFNPVSETEKQEAIQEAFFKVPLFKEIFDRFEGRFPKESLFKNILIRNYGIEIESEAIRLVNLIKDGANLIVEVADVNTPKEIEDETRIYTSEHKPQKGLISSNLFELIKLIGYTESIAEYKNKINISPEVMKETIDKMNQLSDDYASFSTTIGMTNEELKSNVINVDVCLARVKFFIGSLKKDLGIEKIKKEEIKSDEQDTEK